MGATTLIGCGSTQGGVKGQIVVVSLGCGPYVTTGLVAGGCCGSSSACSTMQPNASACWISVKPIVVAGDMAAMWPAIVMNVPAEAARPPGGVT